MSDYGYSPKGLSVTFCIGRKAGRMKDRSFAQNADEREAAFECIASGLPSESLNSSPERKRAIYGAFEARDARFDGRVYAAISSTGVYCRPVCPYHAKIENVTFYATAAEAEEAGYRPCLVCRPETAPGLSSADARKSLARRAAAMIQEECTVGDGLEKLSTRLGYTDRHVRRVFQDEFGVTPMQFLMTCRLRLAKAMLADTDLSMAEVAKAAGFKSTRRFNDAFKSHYGLVPSEQRRISKSRSANASNAGIAIRLRLGYRPPLRFGELLAFFRDRALAGVEVVDESSYARTVCIATPDGGEVSGWIRVEHDPAHNALVLSMSESLLPATSLLVARVRRMFDLDCDPETVSRGLAVLDAIRPGLNAIGTRLPGCFDPFETCCRAVLGQQVSVVAANKLAARIVSALGPQIRTGIEDLDRAWPSAREIAAIDDIAETLGPFGVIRARSAVIAEIARMAESGDLRFDALADPAEQMGRLLHVKGIGPWTANYIAMRACSYPDAFLEKDSGVAHALPDMTPKERIEAVEPCRPWRSYAVICLWNSLGNQAPQSRGEQPS